MTLLTVLTARSLAVMDEQPAVSLAYHELPGFDGYQFEDGGWPASTRVIISL